MRNKISPRGEEEKEKEIKRGKEIEKAEERNVLKET